MKRVILLLVLAVAAFAWAQPREQTAIVAASVDATSLDPWLSTNITDKNVVSHLYDTLLTRDDAMAIQPNLATAYKPVDDTTWEFTLRDGVTFSNGEPLTAEDVAFTVEHFRNPDLNAPSIAQFDPIDHVEVVDEHTVRFVTKEPFPALPAVMTEFWVVPHDFATKAGVMGLNNEPVGSGPYVLDSWTRDQSIVLKANPDWWGGAPQIPYVEFKIVPDQNAQIAQIQTGEVDIVPQLPAEAAPLLKRADQVNVIQAPNPRAYFLGLNMRLDTPLKDPKVREALNYAVNVDEMVQAIYDGQGHVLATLLTPQQFGYDASVKPFGYDPETAKQLLADAGFPDGFSIAMEAPRSRYPKDTEVAQAIAAQLGQVGINVDLKIREWGDYVGQFRSEDGPPIYLLGWSIPTFDPDSILTPLLTDGVTYSRFSDPDLTALIDKARSTVDATQRADIYSQVQQKMKDLAPMVFLYQLDELYGVRDHVNWTPRADERVYLWNASLK